MGTPDERVGRDESTSQGDYVVYYDYPLDQVHDEQGYSDEPDISGEWEQLYDVRPTLLQRLWWQARWTVYLISFSIPLVILAALLIFGWATHEDHPSGAGKTTSTPTPSLPVTGEWPPEVDFVPNTVPAMIRNDLPLAGMKQGYLFEGAAGQFWRITVEPEYGSTLDPQITLYAPSGKLLQQNDNRSLDDPTATIEMALPEDGAYRLLVESAQVGITTGEYLLTLFEE